jgi:uncharacterized OB-fold protein
MPDSSDTTAHASTANTPLAATPYRRPMPVIDVWNKPFWDATREGVFMAQGDEEGHVWFPPSPVSPFTHSDRWEWVALSGRGVVVSWVVFHQKYFAGFADALPYNVAAVQLQEGPLIYTNLVDLKGMPISSGLKVRLQFCEMDGRFQLPVFAPELAS